MFDIGMSEMAIVGVVALIVVGPKDLPMMFRKVGQFVGKARGMARDFSRAMNDAADEAGVKDVTDTLKKASDMSTKGFKDAAKGLGDYHEIHTTPPDGKSAVEAANAAAEKWPPEGEFELSADDGVDDADVTVTKKPAAKKAAAKKPVAKKAAAKKPVAKKAPAKKAPAKKAAAKKPAAKKTAAKKPAKTTKAKT